MPANVVSAEIISQAYGRELPISSEFCSNKMGRVWPQRKRSALKFLDLAVDPKKYKALPTVLEKSRQRIDEKLTQANIP